MARQELEFHYLKIASDRRVRAGGRTAKKRRVIKGKKGIGKFAGLMCASAMTVTTKARGEQISFSLSVEDLNTASGIEHLE
ncbi:ATP-binding protein, partial [Pseudomonas viridiflava]|uniref:ATP-binding protein n=2 Tax=Pseudomonas TaxID=286 RepID=UPI001F1559A5